MESATQVPHEPEPAAGHSAASGCPYHGAAAQRLTARPGTTSTPAPDFERHPDGGVTVRSVALARAVLRASDSTKQNGFSINQADKSPVKLRPPVLFQDGEEHRAQRTAIARYFTPKAVAENYRPIIERYTDELIEELREKRVVDLAEVSLRLAVSIAGQVVGLTDSQRPGMARRLEAFLSGGGGASLSWRPRELLRFLKLQAAIMRFFRNDVKPAIAARRQVPKDDVISHLLSQGAKDGDILIEAITYGAAGMATTREFISVAALHFLTDDDLRSDYVNGTPAERQKILSEILRLEPVVGALFRKVLGELTLDTADGPVTLPHGTAITVDVMSANADETAVGPHPLCLDPQRQMLVKGVQPTVMSFGDGTHRCPGSFLALEESDIFLHRLMSQPGLRIAKEPDMRFNDLVESYELRDFMVELT